MTDRAVTEPRSESSKRQAWLQSLSPDQLETVRSYAWEKLLRARKVKIDGKQISMKALVEDVRKRQQEFDRGVYDEDVRTISRSDAQELVPASSLRPGSYKQILKPEEEEHLELQRLGHGNSFASKNGIFGVPLPWQRNFAFGIFGRPDRVEKYMGSSWSSGNPDVVLDDQALYNDILRRCNQLELTLMLNTSRPLKIQEVRPAVENVLRQGMERLSGSTPLQEEDSTALKNFVHQIDESRLQNTGFVQNGAIIKGTHFLFATDPKGGLSAEAITPGTISERKTSFIGISHNPILTAAVFDAFMGPQAIDPVGKRQVGRAVLWASRGLPFHPTQGKDFAVGVVGEDGRMKLNMQGVEEDLVVSPSLFRLDFGGFEKPRRMLLDKISLAQ